MFPNPVTSRHALAVLAATCVPVSAATWTGATDPSWATAGNWTGTAPDNVTAQAISYDAASAANLTQTLDASYLVSGISVDAGTPGAVSLNNGTGTNILTLGSGGITLAAAGQDLTFGTGSTLALGANQTWSVGTGRTLAFSGTNPFSGTATVGISGGGTVQFGNNATLAGPVSFSGSNVIALAGGGGNATTEPGLNFSGGADFGGAIQDFTSASEARSVGGTLANGTLRVSGTAGMQFKAATSGVFHLETGTGGQIILNNTAINNPQLNVYLGVTGSALRVSSPFNNGVAVIGNLTGVEGSLVSTNFNAADLNVNLPRTLQVNQSTDGTFAGNLVQADALRTLTLEKSGSATLTLTGANTATGGIRVSDGTLRLGGTGSLASPPLTLGNGTTSGKFVVGDDVGPNSITVSSLATSGTGAANAIVAGGSGTSGTLTVNGTGASVFGSVIGGTGLNENLLRLVKAGTGSLTLTGANTYNIGTDVTGGTLIVTGSLASDAFVTAGGTIAGSGTIAGPLTLDTGATLSMPGGATTTSLAANGVSINGLSNISFLTPPSVGPVYDVVTYGAGGLTGLLTDLKGLYRGTFTDDTGNKKITFVHTGVGTRTWNSAGTGVWDVGSTPNFVEGDQLFFNGDTVLFGNPGADATVTLVGRLTPAAVTVSNTANIYTFAGTAGVNDITGTASLTKSGVGTLALSSAHAHTGGTILSGGTLRANATGALGSGTLAVSGGSTLTIGAATTVSGAATFSSANTIGFTGGTLTFAGGADFGGAVQSISSNNEARAIAGTLANGTLRHTAGDLQFNAASTGIVTLEATGGSLIVNNAAASNSQLNVNLSGSASLRLASPFNNATLQIGNLTGTSGTFIRSNFGTGVTGGIRTLEVTQTVTGSFAGTISQADANRQIGLKKAGSARLELTGANLYTGGTTINAGTLLANNTAGSATGSGAVIVNSPGTFGGTGSITGAVTVNSGGTLAPGASVGNLAVGSAVIAGSFACEIDGANADKLAVTGALTITGATLNVSVLGGGATQPEYVITTYTPGGLTGAFTIGTPLPSGYTINYATAGQIKLVSSGPSYSTWAASFSPNPGLAGVDFENDGFENGTEFVLGGSPVSGSNNPKIYSLAADSNDVGTDKELIMTIAVPVGTPVFSAGSPTSTASIAGFGIAVRGSTTLSTFPVIVNPVIPAVTTDLPPLVNPQGGVNYEYRSFSLDGSDGLPGKGFLQVVITNP